MYEDFNFDEEFHDLEFLMFEDTERYALDESITSGEGNTSGLIYKDIYTLLDLLDDDLGDESLFLFYTPESSSDSLSIRNMMLKKGYMNEHSLTSEEKLRMISDMPVSELSELLGDAGFNVSGKRKKLLKIASDNISSIEFENVYHITPEGEKFMKDFEWIDIYEDCLECFEFDDFYNYLNNLETDKSYVEIGLDYVDAHIQNAKKKESFLYLAMCYVAQAFLFEFTDDVQALNSRIKLFILSLNPIFDYDKIYEEYLLFESNVKEIRILLKGNSVDLKPLFDANWDNQDCDKTVISKEEGFNLLNDLISKKRDSKDFTTEYYETYLCEDLQDEEIISIREQLIEMVSSFCDTCLSDEYKELCIRLVKKLIRPEKDNLKIDEVKIWAAAVVYDIARCNNLFENSGLVYTSIDEICEFFNADKDEVLNKAEYIINKFGRIEFDEEFSLFWIERRNAEDLSSFDFDDPMEEFFTRAFALAEGGDINQGLKMLDLVPEDDPDYGRALFFKALMMSEQGFDEEASEFMQQSVEYELQNGSQDAFFEDEDDVDFSNPQELYDEMKFCCMMNEFDKSLRYCDALLELEPDCEEALYCKALSLVGMDRMDEGLETINKCLYLDPESTAFLNMKGSILSDMDRFDEAQECFDKALELNPENTVVMVNKALSYLQSGDDDKAVEYYDKAIEVDPSMLEAVLGKANYYLGIKDGESAQKCMDMADQIDKNEMEYLVTYGETLFAQEKFDEAIECWDKCLDIDSDFAIAWVLKSFAYSALNDEKMFDLCISRAAEIDPLILLTLGDFFDELE